MKYVAFFFGLMWTLTVSFMWGIDDAPYKQIFSFLSLVCAFFFGYFQAKIREVE